MEQESDILQQLEALKQENADLKMRCHTANIKIDRLIEYALPKSQLELQVKNLQNENAAGKEEAELLQNHTSALVNHTSALVNHTSEREQLFRTQLNQLREYLVSIGNSKSFRFAKLLQIINNPEMVNAGSSLGALCKIIAAKLRRQQILPGYLSVSEAISMIDSKIAELRSGAAVPECPVRAVPVKPEIPVPAWSGDQSKLISIVLPIYNQADMAHESIESVLAQTYTNWELIIINDGSTDNLSEVVKPYLSDPRIRYFEQDNQRLPKALSNGFSFANGELLTWTSADNNMRPMMLARLSEFLNTHPEVDMVYADYMVIDDKGKCFTETWFRPHNKVSPESPYLYLPRSTAMLNVVQDNFIGACFMYRKSTLRIIGDYDPQLGVEDYDYWMRINTLLNISHLGTGEILYDYRVHDNTLNAKSAEFRIFEKVQKLMEYEKERFNFYMQPFHVYGSCANRIHSEKFAVQLCEKRINGSSRFESSKKLLAVTGKELAEFTFEELSQYDGIVTFFTSGENNDIGKCSFFIRNLGVICIAEPDTPEYRRLDMMTGNLFTPEDAADIMVPMANNQMFIRKTRTAKELARKAPEVPRQNKGRIAILLDHAGNGGLEQVAYDMAKSFSAAGREVLFICINGVDEGVKIPEGITVTNLDGKIALLSSLLEVKPCDAVFAHYCIQGAKEAFESGTAFYQVLHNNYVWLDKKSRAEYRDCDHYTAGYIAVSANVAWYASECIGLPEDKITIIENGVVPEKFVPSESVRKDARKHFGFTGNEFVLLNPASCYAAKGQLPLVKAFAMAYRENPALRLILAGKIFDPVYYQELVKTIEENHLQDAVIHGNYYENMAELYNLCDTVVLTSFWEGCSLAVAEAIRMNKPLIASKVGDIERQTGYGNALLYDLPVKYLTDIKYENLGALLNDPPDELIGVIKENILKAANGKFPAAAPEFPESSADEVYARYLALLNLNYAGFAGKIIRHKI